MSTTTAKKATTGTKAPVKSKSAAPRTTIAPAVSAKETAPKGAPKGAPEGAPEGAPKVEKPEPKSLAEALITGKTVLMKVRANGTKRSLPYLAPASTERLQAEHVAGLREKGGTVDAIGKDLNVSVATVRRYITNLALAKDVEAGKHNDKWTPGTKEVVVHTVTAAK